MDIILSCLHLVVYAVAIIAVIVYFVRKVLRWSENNHAELIKQEVTLESVKEKYVILGVRSANGLSGPISPRRYYLTFSTQEGKKICCQVPENKFISVSEGAKGILTMQGTRFISFERS